MIHLPKTKNTNHVHNGTTIGIVTKNSNEKATTPEADEMGLKIRMLDFTNAPKNKFIGPAIIKTKINVSEITTVANGICSAEMPKTEKVSTSSIPGRSVKHLKLHLSKGRGTSSQIGAQQSHRSSTTVYLNKGITMKRVNKIVESSTVSSHLSSGCATKNNNVRSQNKAESSQSSQRSDKAVTTKGSDIPVNKPKGKTKPPSSYQVQKPSQSGKSVTTSVQKLTNETIKGPETVPSVEPSPLSAYKTLEEFLDMPEVPLVPINAKKTNESEKPKPLYKSIFWEYVDPNKKLKDDRYSKSRDKEKNYDRVEVKSYMEKQKEIRKMKQLREYKERQAELEKKKQQLKELNEKCRSISAKRLWDSRKSCAASVVPEPHNEKSLSSLPSKHTARHSEGSVAVKLEAKDVEHSKGKSLSEKDLRTTVLLKEFEDIVKKECMEVLRNHLVHSPGGSSNQISKSVSSRPFMLDKAVETTVSLEQNFMDFERSKHSPTLDSMTDDATFIQRASAGYQISLTKLHLAASKIQAAFRGLKVRKILREANVIPYLRHKRDPRYRRRMSFYRTSETSYDSPAKRKLSCMSPVSVPVGAIPYLSSEESIIESASRLSLPARTILPASLRLKPFDEPFPKEVIDKIQQQKLHLTLLKSVHRTRFSDGPNHPGNFADGLNNCNDVDKNLHVRPNVSHRTTFSGQYAQNCTDALKNIDVNSPTIAEVLKEKLRVFSKNQQYIKEVNDNNKKDPIENVSATATTATKYNYESDFESYSERQSSTNFTQSETLSRIVSSVTVESECPESDVNDGRHKSKSREPRRKKEHRKRYRYVDSTTTVDTDVDLLSSVSRDVSTDTANKQSVTYPKRNTDPKSITSANTRTTGTALTTGTTNGPTSSLNIHSLPTPALELCYTAEMERMNILDKAYQLTLDYEKAQQLREEKQQKLQEKEQELKYKADIAAAAAAEGAAHARMEIVKKLEKPSPSSSDINLVLLNCQRDAVRATTELAKWMTELKKSSYEKDLQEAHQHPVNLASMVYAAVDEARRRDDEKRQKRRDIEKKRMVKEREMEKEREREKRKMREQTKVVYRDQQVQFPSSSMCEGSSQSSTHERHHLRRKERPESATSLSRRSEMQSINKAEGKLEKQLKVTKKLLEVYAQNDERSLTSVENYTESVLSESSKYSVEKHSPLSDGIEVEFIKQSTGGSLIYKLEESHQNIFGRVRKDEEIEEDYSEQFQSISETYENDFESKYSDDFVSDKTKSEPVSQPQPITESIESFLQPAKSVEIDDIIEQILEDLDNDTKSEASKKAAYELSKSVDKFPISRAQNVSQKQEIKKLEKSSLESEILHEFGNADGKSTTSLEIETDDVLSDISRKSSVRDSHISDNIDSEMTGQLSPQMFEELRKDYFNESLKQYLENNDTVEEQSHQTPSRNYSSSNDGAIESKQSNNLPLEKTRSDTTTPRISESLAPIGSKTEELDDEVETVPEDVREESQSETSKLDAKVSPEASGVEKSKDVQEQKTTQEHVDDGDKSINSVEDDTAEVFTESFRKSLVGNKVEDENLSQQSLSQPIYESQKGNLITIGNKDSKTAPTEKESFELHGEASVTFEDEELKHSLILESIDSQIAPCKDLSLKSDKIEDIIYSTPEDIDTKSKSEADESEFELSKSMDEIPVSPVANKDEVVESVEPWYTVSEPPQEHIARFSTPVKNGWENVRSNTTRNSMENDIKEDNLVSKVSSLRSNEDYLTEIAKENLDNIDSSEEKSHEQIQNSSESYEDDFESKYSDDFISEKSGSARPSQHPGKSKDSHSHSGKDSLSKSVEIEDVIPEDLEDQSESENLEMDQKSMEVELSKSVDELYSPPAVEDEIENNPEVQNIEQSSYSEKEGSSELIDVSLEESEVKNVHIVSEKHQVNRKTADEDEETLDLQSRLREILGSYDETERSDMISRISDKITCRICKEIVENAKTLPKPGNQPKSTIVKSTRDRVAEILDGVASSNNQRPASRRPSQRFNDLLPTVFSDDASDTDQEEERKSPHIEDGEEEWFEDEMVSGDKEDEALKLEAAKIEEEQNRIENEIRTLEALQAQVPPVTQRLSMSLSEIPDKPPPPYSPPSSESISLSSRSCTICAESKIREKVGEQVNSIWDTWTATNTLPNELKEIFNIPKEQSSTEDTTKFRSIQQTSNKAFDSLLDDFIRQNIKELLMIDDNKSFVDKVRPGPLSLQAQRMRVPKTKEALIASVFSMVKENIPVSFVVDCNAGPSGFGTARKTRLTKWSSRPRDLVDDVLVEELIQEDREWTEFWPEELVVVEQVCEKTIRNCIRDVLRNFNTAYKE